MNASDTRNKSGKVSEGMGGKQSNVVKEMANNTTLLGLGAAGRAGAGPRKQLLVMDEVDGMSGACGVRQMYCAQHSVQRHVPHRACCVRVGVGFMRVTVIAGVDLAQHGWDVSNKCGRGGIT